MIVKLIESTHNPVRLCALASRRCTSKASTLDLLVRMPEDPSWMLSLATDSGHDSVLEHASFTFSIEGISRVTSHQLVRHRLASYSQQSQRYAGFDINFVLPPSVNEKMDDQEVSDAVMALDEAVRTTCDILCDHGIAEEDVRFFIPQGSKTSLIMTMNLRELSHFCGLRRCVRSQWEIRDLADSMAMLVGDAHHGLKKYLVPQCERLGYCPEKKGCGRRPSLDRLITDKALLATAFIRERIEDDDIGEGEE